MHDTKHTTSQQLFVNTNASNDGNRFSLLTVQPIGVNLIDPVNAFSHHRQAPPESHRHFCSMRLVRDDILTINRLAPVKTPEYPTP